MAKQRKGKLFIISAPSGAGKTTLCQALRDRCPDMAYSISYTTREPRNGEKDSVDYHFIDKTAFQQGISDASWAEWAEVHGEYYGTSAGFLEAQMTKGKDVLLDLDVQGALQMRERFPECVMIFIMPPSLSVLKERLVSRGTESDAQVAQRLHNAQMEMRQKDQYDYIIVNDQLPAAVEALMSIVGQYR